jgi:23S rRNA pseudouridine1911/1915/1917 synthase
MKMKVLYEDKDILAIDKPSGISVHPAVEQAHYGAGPDGKKDAKKGKKTKTISEWFAKKYPKSKNVGEPLLDIPRAGIVHRLDKDTSGVLILAKNNKAHEFLKNQFQERIVKKTYVAIVSGWVKNDHGTINKSIGRSPSDFRRRLAGRGARGEMREAVTEYKVLKRFSAPVSQNFSSSSLPRVRGGSHGDKNFKKPTLGKFSLLEIKPKTGRTHQIRVHLKYLNHPVVCDSLYDPKGFCPEGLERMALHAKSIEFKDLKGKLVKVESPVPKEILKVIK